MSQKAEKPPDPAHEAKLAARREKHGARVWAANPRTQELQRKYDAALQQLQILRDGTFCRQYQQMQQYAQRMKDERDAMEKAKEEAERNEEQQRKRTKEEEARAEKYYSLYEEEYKDSKKFSDELLQLQQEKAFGTSLTDGVEAGGRRRRGSSPEPEKEEEESPTVLLCKQHAEDRREITTRLGKIEKTLQGVVAALGFVANANERAAKSKSSGAASSCGQKRKRDGRGGDRKSGLYLLQCRMGQIPLAEACKK